MNLLFELIFVGLFLIPMYYLSDKLFAGYGKSVVVFMAGVLFHLVAEVLGINRAYVMTKV
jgi:hypothetical protein